MRVDRQDFGAIKRSSPTPQGGLRLDAWPTRVGVLKYRKPDGTVTRELRHPDEVFRAESLATLRFAPLTDLHPAGRVDATNYVALQRGHVTDEVGMATEDKKHVACAVLVQDADMLGMIDRGERKELSCGYQCDLDPTPGEYEGEAYDAIQRGIFYNHVALLPPGAGRAGPTAALRLDGLCVTEQQERRDSTMKTVRIDGKDYEVGSDLHLAKLDEQRDAAVKREKDRADAAAKELSETRARADKAELDSKTARFDVTAAKIVKAKFKADEADVTLFAEAIEAGFKLDAKSGRDVVKAYFDAMKKATDAVYAIGGEGEEEEEEEGDEPPKKKDSRDDFAARTRSAIVRADAAERPVKKTAAGARNAMIARMKGGGEKK